MMKYDISNRVLLTRYNELVYGHVEAKKTLIALVNRSKIRHHQKYGLSLPENELLEAGKCLLIGGSGTGKTFLVEKLRQLVDFPFLMFDATQLAPTSASGITIGDMRYQIGKEAYRWVDERKAQGYTNSIEGAIDQTVVFIDEIDKLSTGFEGSGNWNKHVQTNLLTLLNSYDDMKGVSYILSGAFVGLDTGKTSSKLIGFSKNGSATASNGLLDENIVKYGLIPELVGRLSAIVELDKLTTQDYKNILHKTLLPRKLKDLLHFNGQKLDLTEEQTQKLIQLAEKSGQGVRFLKRELDKLCLELEFSYEDNYNMLLEHKL